MRGARGFRWLLRLLPFEIREAHGRDMEQVFRASYADRSPGTLGTVGFWCRSVRDILRVAPRQHAEVLLQDLRYASRTFRSAPAFTVTATLTIALGIGAATSVFAIAQAVLLRPLPYSEPARIAIVWAVPPEGNRTWLSVPELDDVRNRVTAFGSVAGLTDLRLPLLGAGGPTELSVVAASANLPDVFGVDPVIGAWFTAAGDVRNAHGVVVLSHRLWRRRFGARTDIVGTQIQLGGRPHTVVGVMPRGFVIPAPSSVFPSTIDAWVPLHSHVASTARDVRLLHVVGRLRPEASFAEAAEQGAHAGRAVSSAFTEYRGRVWTFDVQSLQADLSRTIRPALLVLFAVVGLVLFIAAANVAALLLSRAAARQHELAVRVALGASAARLVRQLATEALLLGAFGGAVGLGITRAFTSLVHVQPLSSIPRFSEIAVDWTVVAFAFALALGTMVLVAIAPAIAARRHGTVSGALRVRGRSASAVRAGRVLAVAEMALTCTVLVVALLLARGFGQLLQTDGGFRLGNVLTFRVSLPAKYATGQAITTFFDQATDRLRALPGVEEAAAVTQLPLSGASLGSTFFLGPADAARLDADLRGVTPGYFRALDIPVVQGRPFNATDTARSPDVAIVDEGFARKAWPGESAIGKRIRWFRVADREIEVIGVVKGVRHRGFDAPARETVYRPHAQYARPTMFLAMKTSASATIYVSASAAAIAAIDPEQPIAEISTMASLAERSLARPGLGAGLAALFAAIAVLLTTVGTYGLFAYAVSGRRREIGVRLALGATPHAIVRLVLLEGLTLAGIGLALGIPAAWLASNVAEKSLSLGVSVDARLVASAATVILLSTAVACWFPSRRASRVSPAEPLRS